MKKTIIICIAVILVLAVGGIIVYFAVNNPDKGQGRFFQNQGNFPENGMGPGNYSVRGPPEGFNMDDGTKSSITSFFESTSDINEIASYCGQNRNYCFYYCMEINPEHEICSQIQMPADRSMRE